MFIPKLTTEPKQRRSYNPIKENMKSLYEGLSASHLASDLMGDDEKWEENDGADYDDDDTPYTDDEDYGFYQEEQEQIDAGRNLLKTSLDALRRRSLKSSIDDPSVEEVTTGFAVTSKLGFIDEKACSYMKPSKEEVEPLACSICLEEFEDEYSFVQVNECRHTFCRECLGDYISYKSRDASCLFHTVTLVTQENESTCKVEVLKTYGIPCPAMKCKHVMMINELMPVASSSAIDNFIRFSEIHKEDQERIERIREEEEVASAFKLKKRCPRCDSDNIRKIKRGRLQCNLCHTPFCHKCGGQHPPSVTCEKYKEEGFLFLQIKGLTRCPNCHMFTQKQDGCNYMTCRCGQSFCNLCAAALDNTKHWTHFYDAPFGDKCRGKGDCVTIISKK